MKNQKTQATYVIFSLAVLFSLSNLPGAKSEVSSLDQHSFLTCDDPEGQIQANGVATCETEKHKVRGNYTVEKVAQEKGKPEQYKVTSALEAEFCADGRCTQTRTARTLTEAIALGKKLTDELMTAAAKRARAEKERLAKVERCEIEDDEDQTPITKESKVLRCMADKLKEMDAEKAADYYADNMRDRIQALLQSNSPNDRALGMGALGEIGKNLNINCATRPGLPQTNNQFLSHPNLMPQMNNMRPVSQAGTRPGAERNYIAESACDMWAFGTYNNNVQYLQLAAAQPGANRQAIGQALRTLKSGWGTYFQQRGLALQADPLGLQGMSGDLFTDFQENNDRLNANLQSIVDKHKDFLAPAAPANGAGTANSGRLARGGIPAQNSTGTATTVNPWGTPPGVAAPGQPAPPAMRPTQPSRFTGAPRLGSPVGPQSAVPLRR